MPYYDLMTENSFYSDDYAKISPVIIINNEYLKCWEC